jgi:SAM-dependent methyltransferase
MVFSNESPEAPIFLRLKSREELVTGTAVVRGQRLHWEDTLAQAGSLRTEWELSGFCEVCESNSIFVLDWLYADGSLPNFRERLVCRQCGLNNRQRFVLGWLKQEVRNRQRGDVRIYLYEQVTPFYRAACQRLAGCRVTGSEYLGFDKKSGELVNGLRHEDAQALSFPPASLDLVASNDVLEHVPDYRRALAEAARVLAPGGKMIFSIPFYAQEQQTRSRAVLEKNGLRHLLPEQYHGNPVSEKGSLVFHDFGWDILEHCRAAGFTDAYVLLYHDLRRGYLGNGGQIIFLAEKQQPLQSGGNYTVTLPE